MTRQSATRHGTTKRATRTNATRTATGHDRPEERESTQPARKAALVLGMHRSGTSAFTRALSLCGATLPRTLMTSIDGLPGDGNRIAGFWESSVLRDINDRALAAAGSAWDDPMVPDRQWFGLDAARELASELSEALEAEYGEAELVVIKDPRICRLMPLWLDALESNRRTALALIPIRNPLEVAASLTLRDGLPTAKGLVLWLHHLIAAERGSRGIRRCFAGYDELLADWRSVIQRVDSRLDLELQWRAADAEQEIDRFLDPGLRHHRLDADDLEARGDVPAWITTALRWARGAIADPDLDPEPLVQIETQLNAAQALLMGSLSLVPGGAASPAVTRRTTAGDPPRHATTESSSAPPSDRSGLEPAARHGLVWSADDPGRAEDDAARWLTGLPQEQRAGQGLGRARQAGLERLLEKHAVDIAKLLARDHEVVRLWAEARSLKTEVNELRADHALGDTRLIRYGEQASRLDAAVAALDDRVTRESEAGRAHADATTARLGEIVAGLTEDLDGLQNEQELLRSAVAGLRNQLAELRTGQREIHGTQRAELTALRHDLDALTRSATEENARLLLLLEHRGRMGVRGARVLRRRRAASRWRYSLAALAIRLPVWLLRLDLRRRLKLWLDARLIWRSGLFMKEHYLARYPDVAAAGIDPLGHFVVHGTQERRNPNPFFDTGYYVDNNPDVAASGLNPLVHFIVCGATEGRSPGPAFDTRYYVATNPELATLDINPLLHYMELGMWMGRRPKEDDAPEV